MNTDVFGAIIRAIFLEYCQDNGTGYDNEVLSNAELEANFIAYIQEVLSE